MYTELTNRYCVWIKLRWHSSVTSGPRSNEDRECGWVTYIMTRPSSTQFIRKTLHSSALLEKGTAGSVMKVVLLTCTLSNQTITTDTQHRVVTTRSTFGSKCIYACAQTSHISYWESPVHVIIVHIIHNDIVIMAVRLTVVLFIIFEIAIGKVSSICRHLWETKFSSS